MMNDIFGIPDGNYQIIGFTIDVENRTFGYIFQGIRTHGSPNRPTAEYVLAFIELCKARGALSRDTTMCNGKRYGFIYGEMMSPHIENEVTEGEIMGVMEVHITNYYDICTIQSDSYINLLIPWYKCESNSLYSWQRPTEWAIAFFSPTVAKPKGPNFIIGDDNFFDRSPRSRMNSHHNFMLDCLEYDVASHTCEDIEDKWIVIGSKGTYVHEEYYNLRRVFGV